MGVTQQLMIPILYPCFLFVLCTRWRQACWGCHALENSHLSLQGDGQWEQGDGTARTRAWGSRRLEVVMGTLWAAICAKPSQGSEHGVQEASG